MADISKDIVVVGTGLMNSVGLSSSETAASVLASTARFMEIDWYDKVFEPFKVAHVIEDGLPEEPPFEAPWPTYRERRMLRLASQPLREAASVLDSPEALPLFLALPETDTTTTIDGPAFLERLAAASDGLVDAGASRAEARGRAGGLSVVADAAEALESGAATFVLAGGVDSYVDLHVLGTLDHEKRVKSSVNLDGFIPGEGAACLLLTQRGIARARNLKVLARITPAARSEEEGHLMSDLPYRGEGLAAAFADFFAAGHFSDPIGEVYSSMNGENHWAREWGVAFLRHQKSFEPEHDIHHPADCYGDIGAACGATLVTLAALGMSGGYRRSPGLVYCSSDRAARTVLGVAND